MVTEKAPLTIPDNYYFNWTNDAYIDLVGRLAKQEKYFGVTLFAPDTVDITTRTFTPLIMARRLTGQREWEVAFDSNTALFAVDTLDGSLQMQEIKPPPKGKRLGVDSYPRSRQGDHPDEVNATSTGSQVQHFNLTEFLALPHSERGFHVTVVYFDQLSNTVKTRLVKGSAGAGPVPVQTTVMAAAAMADSIAATAATQKPGSVYSFDKLPQSPTVAKQGIALSGDSKSYTTKVDRIAVYGTLKLPLPAYSIVSPDPGVGEVPRKTPSGLRLPRAVVNATLVFFKLDQRYRPTVKIKVPIYARETLSEGDVATGHFALNIKSEDVREFFSEAGSYLVYCFVDGAISAPLTLKVS